MTSARAPGHARDGQQRTGFTASLETLVETSAGCLGAVLVDGEGETVDYAGRLAPYDVKLAAAHFQIVLRELCNSARGDEARGFTVRAQRYGYVAWRLFGGYVLVLVFTPESAAHFSQRALRQVEIELSREASWPLEHGGRPRWTRVYVSLGSGGVPLELWLRDGARERLTLLGPAANLGDFERGYRVSLPSGGEQTLVREPNGIWYLDRPPR